MSTNLAEDYLAPSPIGKSELGQVWTPHVVADLMVRLLGRHISFDSPLLIIDPAVGPATFLASLYRSGLLSSNITIKAYDIDPEMVVISNDFIAKHKLKGNAVVSDYITSASSIGQADLIIQNPPYIRHEKISNENKKAYKREIKDLLDEEVGGRSNLYVYFLLKSLADLKPGGLLCAIVYDGLTQSHYGKQVLDIIRHHAEVLHLETTKTPFANVIIDATILIARRSPHRTFPNFNITSTSNILLMSGHAQMKDVANIRRGTGLINSRVFLAKPTDPFYKHSVTFVKKQLHVSTLVIPSSHPERAYLFENIDEVPEGFLEWLRQQSDALQKDTKTIYELMSSRPSGWFLHSAYKPPIIFNYYIRNAPRHLYNFNRLPVSDNFYGIEPKGISAPIAWLLLNSDIFLEAILQNARTQGSGLKKLQLYEYKEAVVPDWRLFPEALLAELSELADKALELEEINAYTGSHISDLVNEYISTLGR